ncbi:copper resistance protein NlpE N-terminal domain-containing protein [Capnocytophaga sp. oral taxon 903]|uniref:copper resistance protein NlpE N-terminal domain-containing protein n=1 Tax=Capnocytophaga sp. oral taxon 903 TaxID=2748317 RepID=UPI0015B9483C|nr:copper resistance protein NlpE N-terminal domain-containing protein [Capnocytophaga sp. oral taxon 903]NWO29357.1 copper resistance protein NlpE N-terminal domain-containing protein [Capnocytophaga sp. oral taxon 903]
MKNHILTLGVAVLMFASCQNNPSQNANNMVSDTTTMMENTMDNVSEKMTPELVATYVGTLPAADCGGMATVIHLYADDTYVKQENCASKNFESKEEGKVEHTDKGFTLVSKADNHKSFYITKGDNIVQVGEDGKEPKMVKEYTLTKQM